jgi:hypothetical protein
MSMAASASVSLRTPRGVAGGIRTASGAERGDVVAELDGEPAGEDEIDLLDGPMTVPARGVPPGATRAACGARTRMFTTTCSVSSARA